MIEKFYEEHVKEVSNLVKLLKTYRSLLNQNDDFKSKKFYEYSIKLTISRINELIGGNEDVNSKFKKCFDEEVSNLFEDASIENPFKGLD